METSFHCGKEAKALPIASYRGVFSGGEWIFLHLPLIRLRAFFLKRIASKSVFPPRIYDERLSAKNRKLKYQKFHGSLPGFSFLRLPSKNSVFREISVSFSCLLALLSSSFCGVKSEIRPDVN
jgi:hypothetical protein